MKLVKNAEGKCVDEATGIAIKADSGVAELQQALIQYAEFQGDPKVHPGPVDGICGLKTLMATINVIPHVPKMPSRTKLIVGIIGRVADKLKDNSKIGDDVSEVLDTAADILKEVAGETAFAILGLEIFQEAKDGPGAEAGAGIKPSGGVTTTVVKTGWKTGPKKNAYYADFATQILTKKFYQAPTIIRTPNGDVPGLPAPGETGPTIYTKSWLTGQYRLAAPRPKTLGAPTYTNYVELSPSVSQPAAGTAVDRSTFEQAVGRWYATTPGIAAIVAGVLGASAGAFFLVRRR